MESEIDNSKVFYGTTYYVCFVPLTMTGFLSSMSIIGIWGTKRYKFNRAIWIAIEMGNVTFMTIFHVWCFSKAWGATVEKVLETGLLAVKLYTVSLYTYLSALQWSWFSSVFHSFVAAYPNVFIKLQVSLGLSLTFVWCLILAFGILLLETYPWEKKSSVAFLALKIVVFAVPQMMELGWIIDTIREVYFKHHNIINTKLESGHIVVAKLKKQADGKDNVSLIPGENYGFKKPSVSLSSHKLSFDSFTSKLPSVSQHSLNSNIVPIRKPDSSITIHNVVGSSTSRLTLGPAATTLTRHGSTLAPPTNVGSRKNKVSDTTGVRGSESKPRFAPDISIVSEFDQSFSGWKRSSLAAQSVRSDGVQALRNKLLTNYEMEKSMTKAVVYVCIPTVFLYSLGISGSFILGLYCEVELVTIYNDVLNILQFVNITYHFVVLWLIVPTFRMSFLKRLARLLGSTGLRGPIDVAIIEPTTSASHDSYSARNIRIQEEPEDPCSKPPKFQSSFPLSLSEKQFSTIRRPEY